MASSTPESSPTNSARTRPLWQRFVVGEHTALVIVLGLLIAFFGSQSRYFLSTATLTAVINQIPALTLVAIGMTFVLITGGIDLSVGSLLALSSSTLAVLIVQHSWSIWLAVPAALMCGGLCGLVNGSVSVLAGIPSFIVSLGVLQVARGLAYVLTDSTLLYIDVRSGIQSIGRSLPGLKVSPAFLTAIVTVLAGQFVLHRTLFGRYSMAIGFNETVVKLSGVNTRRVRIGAFVLSGVLAAAAGVVEASRLSAGDPNGAIGFELYAIAAAVIGGTSLMGGRGSMINTLLGVLIIAVLQTGLIQLGISEGAKYITTGCVIVVAVLLDASRERLQRLTRQLFGG
ncbi:MAG: ABC transporter permease [Planctomycetaceae bacterium]|nr:ABC transporter permease [Planctomycetaceae bacterium]